MEDFQLLSASIYDPHCIQPQNFKTETQISITIQTPPPKPSEPPTDTDYFSDEDEPPLPSPTYLSPTALHTLYNATSQAWDASPRPTVLNNFLASRGLLRRTATPLTNCVCLALGPISRQPHPDYEDKVDYPSIEQLVTLVKILDTLAPYYQISKSVYFQDPDFTSLDEEFLTGLGYTVLKDPEAMAKVTESTFLCSPFCPIDVLVECFLKASPAIYLGCEVDGIVEMHQSEIIAGLVRTYAEGTVKRAVPDLFGMAWLGTELRWRKSEDVGRTKFSRKLVRSGIDK